VERGSGFIEIPTHITDISCLPRRNAVATDEGSTMVGNSQRSGRDTRGKVPGPLEKSGRRSGETTAAANCPCQGVKGLVDEERKIRLPYRLWTLGRPQE
jgi:hypothetical protein